MLSEEYGHYDQWTGRIVRPDEEDIYWYGHSLPPALWAAPTDSRGVWRRKEANEMTDLLMPEGDMSLSRFHRRMKETVEVAQVYGECAPLEFKQILTDFLSE